MRATCTRPQPEHWVEQGRTRHYVIVPADEALVDAWFRVGFGSQQAHGIQEVPAHTEVVVPDGFEIRPPEESEIETLIDVGLALPQHQAQAPGLLRATGSDRGGGAAGVAEHVRR